MHYVTQVVEVDSSPYIGRPAVPTVVVPYSSLSHTQAARSGSNSTEPRITPPDISQSKIPPKPPRTPSPTEAPQLSHLSSSPSRSPTTPSKVGLGEEYVDGWLAFGGDAQGGPSIALHIRRPQGDEDCGTPLRGKDSWAIAAQGWGPDDVIIPDEVGDASMSQNLFKAYDVSPSQVWCVCAI